MNKKTFIMFLLCFMFVGLLFNCSSPNVYANESEYRVIYNYVYIYSTTDTSAKIKKQDSQEYYILNYDSLVTKTNQLTGVDGLVYYQIDCPFEELIGQDVFVLASGVLQSSIQSPIQKLDSNAKTNKQCYIYSYDSDNQYQKTDIVLQEGQKVRLINGYNKNEDYLKIQYEGQDGDLDYGFIKTSDIAVSGISTTTISTIIIIVTTISLALIIFGIGKNKKKKKD